VSDGVNPVSTNRNTHITMRKKNNTYRTKGRAVFLAAIMIISVLAMPVAFSGAGAAQVGDISDAEAGDVAAGASADYHEVTFNISLDAGEEDTINLDYSVAAGADAEVIGAVASSGDENITADADFSEDEVTVAVENIGSTDLTDVMITVGVSHNLADVDPVLGVPVEISSEGDSTVNETANFDVSGIDVVASNRAYEGQFIQTSAASGNEDVELIRDYDESGDGDNEFIDVEQADDGFVFFETEGLDTGQTYSLVNSGGEIGSVQLTANRYSAEWDESEVEDAGASTVDVEIDANRGSYTIYVTADGLDSDEIFGIFNNSDTTDNIAEAGDGVILYDIRDGDYTGDFAGIDTGEYDFEFDMVDTVATDSSTITVVDGDDNDLVLVEQNVDVSQGDVAEIEIEDVGGVDVGYLVIGGFDEVGYEAVIKISDIDADTFVIEFNTYLAGSDRTDIVSSDDATVEILEPGNDNQAGIDGILDIGDYDLSLGTNFDDADASDEEAVQEFIDNADQVGALFIEARNVGDMNLWTATSSNAGDVEDAEDIVAAIEAGLITETDAIAFEDALVHQIELDGVGGFLGGADDDLDQALITAIELGVVSLNIEQTDETRQSNRRAVQLNDSALSTDDINVVYEGGELFVIIESVDNDLTWTDSNNNERTVQDGDAFTVEVEILDQRLLEVGDEQDPYTPLESDDEDDSLVIGGVEFSVSDREGEFINLNDDDKIEVEASGEQAITAETNVAPGTEFTIRANGEGDARFVKTLRDLVVQPDGTVVGEFDFSDRNVDEEFTVQLRGGNLEGDRPEADGIIVESIDAPEEEPEEEPVEEEPVEEEPVEEEPEEEEPVEETEDDTPGFGALVALLAILGAALLAARRQN